MKVLCYGFINLLVFITVVWTWNPVAGVSLKTPAEDISLVMFFHCFASQLPQSVKFFSTISLNHDMSNVAPVNHVLKPLKS